MISSQANHAFFAAKVSTWVQPHLLRSCAHSGDGAVKRTERIASATPRMLPPLVISLTDPLKRKTNSIEGRMEDKETDGLGNFQVEDSIVADFDPCLSSAGTRASASSSCSDSHC